MPTGPYQDDLNLVPRKQPGSMITDEDLAVERCIRMVKEGMVTTITGKDVPIRGDTLCVHGDGAKALAFVERIYHDLIRKSGRRITLEVSIDETETETTPAAHYFAARELQKRGVKIGSVAPRFCGEFQKGIDYIGDKKRFEEEFAVHAQIAKALGYRISVHSGSDKFSIFPYVGKLSGFCFHLKTSGTSWAEAVRVIAACNPELFRRMMKFSCEKFAEAKAYYHVSGQAEKVPPLDGIAGVDLPHLLDETDARQVAHITYGFLLQAAEEKPLFRDEIYDTLRRHKTALDAVITTPYPPPPGMPGRL